MHASESVPAVEKMKTEFKLELDCEPLKGTDVAQASNREANSQWKNISQKNTVKLKMQHHSAFPSNSKQLKPPVSNSKPRHLQMKLLDSFTSLPPPTTPDNPIIIDDSEGLSERPAAKMEGRSRGRRHGKRKSETQGGPPIIKALKQMEKVVVTCPVCSKEFADVSNFDLNQHLDVCLGAQKSPTVNV